MAFNGTMTRNEVRRRRDRSVSEAFGDWCQRIAVTGNEKLRHRIRKAAMSENVGAQGGYTAPPELIVGVDEMLQEYGIFHNYAQVFPMNSDEVWYPAFDISASQASGESPLYGGMAFAWTQEGQTIAESDPNFVGGTLRANDLCGLVTCSDQLIEDGGEALGKYLESAFYRLIEFTTEREFFKGSGVGKPMGVNNSPATLKFTRAGGAGSATLVQADLAGMVGALIPACFQRALWAVNPSTLVKLAAISTAYFINKGVPTDGSLPALCGSIFGRPMFSTEKLPVLGGLGDVMLFDPYMYAVGRRSTEISASPHPNFTKRQTIYRVVWRGAGQPIPKGTGKLADGSTTAGCFVALN